MKLSRWISLGLITIAVPAWGQDSKSTTADNKQQVVEEALKKVATAIKEQQLNTAEHELQAAQRIIQNAQSQFQNAQREVDRAVRRQSDTAKAASNVRSSLNLPIARFRHAGSGTATFFNTLGLEMVEADAVLRAQLGLPDDQGLVVVKITGKGLADQAGLKANDVIVKLNDQAVAKVEQARDVFTKIGSGAVGVNLIREGKPRQLSMIGHEQGTQSTFTTYWIGVPVAPVDATLRSHLTALPADAGLIATDVVADSPAAKARVQKNDILIKFNDQPINSQEALVDQVQKSNGKESKLEVLRAGKVLSLTLTAEKRATATFDAFPGLFKQRLDSSDKYLPRQDYMFNSNGNAMLFNYDNIAKNPYRVDSLPGTTGPQIANLLDRELQDPDYPNLTFMTPGSQKTAEQLEKEMKSLTAQIEELRKILGEMSRKLAADKEPKKQD